MNESFTCEGEEGNSKQKASTTAGSHGGRAQAAGLGEGPVVEAQFTQGSQGGWNQGHG